MQQSPCRKQKKTKVKPEATEMARKLVHILPVVPTRTRQKGFDVILPVQWGNVDKLRIMARETLNTFDLLTLLAVVKLFIEKPVVHGGVVKDEKGNIVRELSMQTISRYEFTKNYRHLDPNHSENITLVYESLLRLSDCSWIYYLKKDKGKVRLKVIYDFQEKDGKWSIYVNKTFVENCILKSNTLTIVLNLIRKCKTDTAKLLCYWLQGQKNTHFSEDTLIRALHLSYQTRFHAREKLRQTFEELKRAGFITSWHEKLRRQNHIFFFKKARKIT